MPRTPLLAGLLILISSFVFGQSDSIQEIYFTYDKAGNRTSREVVYYEGGLKSLSRSTEIEEEEIDFDKQLKVYPNPFTHSIYVTLNNEAYEAKTKMILIFDSMGRILKQFPVYEYVNQIDASTLRDGTYIIKLTYDGKHKEWILIKN